MKKIIAIMFIMLAAAGCASSSGPGPEGDFEVFQINLEDGRALECISSATYGGSGVLDCNWEEIS